MIDIVAEYRNGRRDFRFADLTGANLTGATLTGANLTRANLTGANLTGANLTDADLTNANLTNANLTNADLPRAYLTGADLTGARLPHFMICPESGSFHAVKRLRSDVLARVIIPEDARRTSSMVGRKCRASHVVVDRLFHVDGHDLPNDAVGYGLHDSTEYRVGATVAADAWDDDVRVECTHGIHFFMTLREAIEYR